MKSYNMRTPEGIRDLLFEECEARRKYENIIRSVFMGRGYNEVVTGGLEYYDVFASGTRHFPQENMYKLVDNKGRLLVCRPDNTTPIARLVATRLKDEPLPIRLFYNQDIYQMTKSLAGRSDEVVQMGIELIGSASPKADIEVLVTALDTLMSCNSSDFRLEIGHSGYFKVLSQSLKASDDVKDEVRTLTEQKNYAALNDLLDKQEQSAAVKALKKLPSLFGGEEVIDEAEKLFDSAEAKEILEYLRELYSELGKLGLDDKVIIDLGLVNRNNYYTGVVFRGYISGSGDAVLSGGRYDSLLSDFGLNLPAIGFGADISAIASALAKNADVARRSADVVIFAEMPNQMKGLMYEKQLISEGLRCENCLCDTRDEAVKYAAMRGVAQLHYVKDDSVEIIDIKA